MKKILLLLTFAGSSTCIFSQTLFTYGNMAVDKSEFTRAYNKNKTPVNDKEKALREYLDLYIKFKLKVKAAMELRLDSLPQLQYDAQSFRSQIESSYLNNEKAVNELLDEAFTRSQQDLHTLHFFVPADPTSKPEDTLKTYKGVTALHTALVSGKTDYDNLIAAASPVKANHSDLGYITAFSLPYEYETIIYNLKPGQSSKPYRTKKGWHIFKLTGQRKAVGKWKVAQILFSIPPDATAQVKAAYQKKADSVYQLLARGADFGKMARGFSDDKVTYGNNGEMAEFGSGKFETSFENEVFKLTKDNEISKPFLTPYGYHIVKRISQNPVAADKKDQGFLFELRQRIQQDARINIAKEMFVKEVLKQVGFKRTGTVSDADLYRYADSVIAKPASQTHNAVAYPIANKTIYSFAKSKLTGRDFLDFVRTYKGSELYKGETNATILENFIASSVMEYYKKNLEDYNPEFRYQMDEFKDGNVLFEIMERNIWGKAANDMAGLQQYYSGQKNRYQWAASVDAIIFNSSDKNIAENARAAVLAGNEWKKIAEEGNNNLQADSGRFELTQMPVVVTPNMQAGTVSQIVINPTDGNAGFAKIIRHYSAGLQRSFEEARGLLINDYQNVMEDKWIMELKKKYPIKINEAVFQSLLK